MRSAGSSRCRRRWPDAGSRCRPHTARTTSGLLMPVAYMPDGRSRHPASWGTGDPRTRSPRGHQIRRPCLDGAWSPAPVPRPGVSAHTAHATPGSRMRIADISLAVAGPRVAGPRAAGPGSPVPGSQAQARRSPKPGFHPGPPPCPLPGSKRRFPVASAGYARNGHIRGELVSGRIAGWSRACITAPRYPGAASPVPGRLRAVPERSRAASDYGVRWVPLGCAAPTPRTSVPASSTSASSPMPT
jgi:hypothetical protein